MLRFRRGYEASQINGMNKQNILFEQDKCGDFLTGLYAQNTSAGFKKCLSSISTTDLIRLRLCLLLRFYSIPAGLDCL